MPLNFQFTNTTTAKLRKTVSTGKTPNGGITDYSGPFLYRDNQLSCIFTPAGRIIPISVNGNVLWKYEYNLTDHLGNVRVVFAAYSHGQPEVMQQTGYYPFGMTLQQQNFGGINANPNKLLYNSKELQDDELAGSRLDWYDYGARFYDAQLGRWHVVDPLAEKYYPISPYAYVANNPIIFIDPTGMAIEYSQLYEKDKDGNYIYEQQIRAFEAFAMTPQGQQYILERAQEGFELVGVFEKDLSIKVDKAGALDQKGIDVSFSVKELQTISRSGEMGMDVKDGRLKLSVNLAPETNTGTKEQVFSIAATIGHETFYHGAEYEKRFLSLPASDRTKANVWTPENFSHQLILENTMYYQVGVDYLQNVQKVLGYQRINSRDFMYFNIMLPSLGGYRSRSDIKH